MLILDRYIAKAIMQAVAISIVLIMGIVTLLSILSELKNLGNGDYHFLQLGAYVALRLPSELYHFSPMIILLGTIGGLLILTRSNELVVMRASGFSNYQITRAILITAFLIIIGISLIGETIGHRLSLQAIMQKENARNAGRAIVTGSGVWFHVNGDFIHIDQVISKDFLQGITRYEFDRSKQLKAIYAADMLLLQQKTWSLKNVKKTSFFPDQTKSEILPILPWNVQLNAELFSGIIEPSEMSLKKLARFSSYLKQNGLQAGGYEYAFWQRILQPFVNLLMVLIAIPFAFNASYRNQYGMQMMGGILLGISFFIVDAFLEQVCIIYQLPAWGAALLPLLILSSISYFFMRKLFI